MFANLLEANVVLKYSEPQNERKARWMTKRAPCGAFTRACTITPTALSELWGNLRSRLPAAAQQRVLAARHRPANRSAIFTSPFSSFYFGAFGNNYVDHGTISRYRDY